MLLGRARLRAPVLSGEPQVKYLLAPFAHFVVPSDSSLSPVGLIERGGQAYSDGDLPAQGFTVSTLLWPKPSTFKRMCFALLPVLARRDARPHAYASH